MHHFLRYCILNVIIDNLLSLRYFSIFDLTITTHFQRYSYNAGEYMTATSAQIKLLDYSLHSKLIEIALFLWQKLLERMSWTLYVADSCWASSILLSSERFRGIMATLKFTFRFFDSFTTRPRFSFLFLQAVSYSCSANASLHCTDANYFLLCDSYCTSSRRVPFPFHIRYSIIKNTPVGGAPLTERGGTLLPFATVPSANTSISLSLSTFIYLYISIHFPLSLLFPNIFL